jgi:hypothetical protein
MIITSVDESTILDSDLVVRVLRQLFPADAVTESASDVTDGRKVDVETDPWFRVDVSSDGSQADVNGVPEQNARVAAAIRAAIPQDAPRIIAMDPDLGSFIDLTPGITADEIQAGWRPMSEFSTDA